LEFRLMGAMHVSVCNLLRLDVLVQLLLPILQTHCDIGRALGPPEEIEIIAETLTLIEQRHSAEHPILALKGNGSILKGGRFLTWRIRFPAKRARCLTGALTSFWRFIAQKEKLRF